jgi:hypothetical protein
MSLLTIVTPMPHSRRPFKFELGWICRDGFLEMVKNTWEKPVAGMTPIQRWNNKPRSIYAKIPWWVGTTHDWEAQTRENQPIIEY